VVRTSGHETLRDELLGFGVDSGVVERLCEKACEYEGRRKKEGRKEGEGRGKRKEDVRSRTKE
jgi:hypothetical protein